MAEAIFLNREEVPVPPLYYDPGGWAGSSVVAMFCPASLPVLPFLLMLALLLLMLLSPPVVSRTTHPPPCPALACSARLWVHALRPSQAAVHAGGGDPPGAARRRGGAGHPGGGQRLGREGKGWWQIACLSCSSAASKSSCRGQPNFLFSSNSSRGPCLNQLLGTRI